MQTVQMTGDSSGAVLEEDVDAPVVAKRQGYGQTVQKTVLVPQVQLSTWGLQPKFQRFFGAKSEGSSCPFSSAFIGLRPLGR